MREAFSAALVELARADPNVVLLTGDHGYALFDAFRRECPTQYINAGIAEQNMVGMASGLARGGFRPFVYGLSAFVPVRVLEQIKLDVAHDGLPVVFLGDGAGFVYSHLGTSHQSTEDIACTRAIPGLSVLSPADRHEMTWAMNTAYALSAPVYLRMGKSDLGDVHSGPIAVTVGEPLMVQPGGGNVAILATGSMVRSAVAVASRIGAAVWSVPSIKPLAQPSIAAICRASRGLVVIEEHSVNGGLGGLIAEIAAIDTPVRILRLGVEDRFSEFCGSYGYLLQEHGIDEITLRAKVESFAASL